MITVTTTYVRYATSIEFEPCIKLSIATDIKKLLSFEENNNNNNNKFYPHHLKAQ